MLFVTPRNCTNRILPQVTENISLSTISFNVSVGSIAIQFNKNNVVQKLWHSKRKIIGMFLVTLGFILGVGLIWYG